jgi:hypothetical protein
MTELDMFKTHNPQVRQFAQFSPENMEQVFAFIQASIREGTYKLYEMMALWRQLGLSYDRLTWGNKGDAMKHIDSHRNEIYKDIMKAIRSRKHVTHKIIDIVTDIPGFGVPKAGFASQLIHGSGGCLDVHNKRMYGITDNFDVNKVSPQLKAKRIDNYVIVCNNLGGARKLWDVWCTFVANKYPKHFESPEVVSKLHVDCLYWPIVKVDNGKEPMRKD